MSMLKPQPRGTGARIKRALAQFRKGFTYAVSTGENHTQLCLVEGEEHGCCGLFFKNKKAVFAFSMAHRFQTMDALVSRAEAKRSCSQSTPESLWVAIMRSVLRESIKRRTRSEEPSVHMP